MSSGPVRANDIFPDILGQRLTFYWVWTWKCIVLGVADSRLMGMNLFQNGFNIQQEVNREMEIKLDPDKLPLKSCIK